MSDDTRTPQADEGLDVVLPEDDVDTTPETGSDDVAPDSDAPETSASEDLDLDLLPDAAPIEDDPPEPAEPEIPTESMSDHEADRIRAWRNRWQHEHQKRRLAYGALAGVLIILGLVAWIMAIAVDWLSWGAGFSGLILCALGGGLIYLIVRGQRHLEAVRKDCLDIRKFTLQGRVEDKTEDHGSFGISYILKVDAIHYKVVADDFDAVRFHDLVELRLARHSRAVVSVRRLGRAKPT